MINFVSSILNILKRFMSQGGKMCTNFHTTMAQWSIYPIILLLCIGANLRVAGATGVFELELISLKQIDSTTAATTTNRLNDIRTTNIEQQQQQQQHHHHSNSTNFTATTSEPNRNDDFVRIFVCLKEAFTSKLDGPCTFGNASITLNRDSIQQPQHQDHQVATSATRSQTNQEDHIQAPSGNKQQQLSQGSLMTNVVRILFTFRWTKSFTIILTAEQIDEDSDNQHEPSSPPSPATIGQNYRTAAQVAASGRHHGATMTAAAAAAAVVANGTYLSPTTLNGRKSFRAHLKGDQVSSGGGQPQVGGGSSNKFRFIDRHVLTENEVLPNLEPNPNKPWASRFSRNLKSSLAYRFRIYCSLNYYGDGCTTFCRPRDDQFGHFNCSSTGQKVCLDGWHGPDCDKARCRSGCNQLHGYCEKPDTCQCRPGWTGLRCDECITYPGCQNGYCLSPWQCVCERNWGGVLCDQDLNYCGTHDPCRNNGTCQNIAPGKYKCTCPDGFTGVDCDINLDLLQDADKMTQLSAGCALNPCLNGGTCFGFNNSPLETRTPADAVDGIMSISRGSSNEHSERIYRCQCAPGWTGDYCQWSDINSMLITSLILNATSEPESSNSRPDYNGQQANATSSLSESVVTISANEPTPPEGLRGDEDKNAKLFLTNANFIETPPLLSSPSPHHLDMKHLISGVVIASVFGVFLASLLLAWCCLVAIERNKFPFIQMNIIRRGEGCEENGLNDPVVSSTLRRMHGKIRDSLRLPTRSSRIKPETKLSIENVLRPPRPPPSYEQSNISCGNYQHVNRISIGCPIYHRS